MSQDVLRQIQGLQGCREPQSLKVWLLENLRRKRFFERMDACEQAGILCLLWQKVLIFVEKEGRTGVCSQLMLYLSLPSKGEVWSGVFFK